MASLDTFPSGIMLILLGLFALIPMGLSIGMDFNIYEWIFSRVDSEKILGVILTFSGTMAILVGYALTK